VVRPRLLRPCAQPARRGQGLRRTPRWRSAARPRGVDGAARHRPQHRRRDPFAGLGRSLPDPGWQRQARARARARHRGMAGGARDRKAHVGDRASAAARRAHGRLHAGADGFRCHVVHPRRSRVRALPAAVGVRCVARGPRRRTTHAQARQAAARTPRTDVVDRRRRRPRADAAPPADRHLGIALVAARTRGP